MKCSFLHFQSRDYHEGGKKHKENVTNKIAEVRIYVHIL